MDSPDTWIWIWLVAAFVFAAGEMASPGSFFLLPFAVGALVASALAFAGVGLIGTWSAFIGMSLATLVAMRPLARRLDQADVDHGIGARRLVGQAATVIQEIPGTGELGLVRVQREDWRAESLDGTAIAAGTAVRVAEVVGTRVLVVPVDSSSHTRPPPITPPPPHNPPFTTPPQGADP
jgi:membrane protein implicated in regulation of membrane protease activity